MSNRVLELDGVGAHVRLPDKLLEGLEEVSVEAWVRWLGLGNYTEVFGLGSPWQVLAVNNDATSRDLQFFIYSRVNRLHRIRVPGILHLDRWYHLAAVNGRAGMQLFVNGVPVGEHPFCDSFARVSGNQENFLGRPHWKENAYFRGQLAEVRLWAGARSAAQIQRDMHRSLQGDEAGLTALWNFAGGDATDATGHGFDGVLQQGARCVAAQLPATVVHPGSISGRVVDSEGEARVGAAVRLEAANILLAETETDDDGCYRLAILPRAELTYDLGVTLGEHGAWHMNLPLAPGGAPPSERGPASRHQPWWRPACPRRILPAGHRGPGGAGDVGRRIWHGHHGAQ